MLNLHALLTLSHDTNAKFAYCGVLKEHVCVLFLKVESEDKFERIGGSSIGGGTFWGLGALLTKTKVVNFLYT